MMDGGSARRRVRRRCHRFILTFVWEEEREGGAEGEGDWGVSASISKPAIFSYHVFTHTHTNTHVFTSVLAEPCYLAAASPRPFHRSAVKVASACLTSRLMTRFNWSPASIARRCGQSDPPPPDGEDGPVSAQQRVKTTLSEVAEIDFFFV